MQPRVQTISLAIVVAIAVGWAAQENLPAQTRQAGGRPWTVSRTPSGDPDLQGFWTNTTTTPLQRPADLAEKSLLTPEEVAKRNVDVATRQSADNAPRRGDPGKDRKSVV